MKRVGSLSVLLGRSAGPGTGPGCGVPGGAAVVPADNGMASLGKFAIDDSMGGLSGVVGTLSLSCGETPSAVFFKSTRLRHLPQFRMTARRGVSLQQLCPGFSFQAGMAACLPHRLPLRSAGL